MSVLHMQTPLQDITEYKRARQRYSAEARGLLSIGAGMSGTPGGLLAGGQQVGAPGGWVG